MSTLPTVTRLITWLPVGGIERRLVSVLPKLRDRGWPVRLVCLRELGPLAQELIDKNIPVDLVKLRTRLDPFGIRRVAALLRATETRLVHAHMYRAMVPGTIAARVAKVPVVFSQVHNVDTWESPRQAWMDRKLSAWRTGTLCVSQAVQEDVCKTLGLPPGKAPVLYNGVDTDRFRPDAAMRDRARAELGLAAETRALLVPARLHENKNPLGVLKAFLAASERANAVLLYAGAGPMEAVMREAIAAASAADRVRLLGRRDDMPELYNAADVVVLSSFKEGFSNAIVEALACGRPVIAADVGGNREAVDRAEVGWIHEAGDTETLAKQMAEALAEGDGLRAREDACRRRGLDFGLDKLVDETDALYRRALREAGVL